MLRYIALLALAAGSLLAQGSATLSGTVTDPSGGVVPDAGITIINISTNWSRNVTSGSDGRYLASFLPVGEYKIEVELQGFKKLTRTGIELNADASVRADLKLEIGETVGAITVSDSPALVDTARSMQVTLVDSSRMRELPLLGRNPLSLQSLQPGVVGHSLSTSGENSHVAINGARGSQSDYTLDGGNAVDIHNQSPAVTPSPDALEEFSIIQFPNSAEYGRGTGGQVNMVTKSGTNRWHGSAFDYLRNDKLNARGFFSSEREAYRKNQFGGTLGGPVWKDHTFFFFSYQGTRQRVSSTRSVSYLPSDAERGGDFTQSARVPTDPLTGSPFPNGRIPASRIDPASRKFIELFLPRTPWPVGGIYRYSYPTKDDSDQYMIRGDHSLSSADRLTGRMFWNRHENLAPASNNLPGFVVANGWLTRNLTVSETHIFGNHLVNDFRYTFNRVNETGWPISGHSLADLGVKIYLPPETRGYKPWIYLNTNDFGVRDQRPGVELRDVHDIANTLLYVRRNHNVKIGFRALRTITDYFLGGMATGYYSFTSASTRVSFGDFLLGLPASFRQSNAYTQRNHGTEWSLFVQDDFKVTRTFTLNFGLRWDPSAPPRDLDRHVTYWNEGQASTVYKNAPLGMLFPGDAGVPDGTPYFADLNNLAPRVGFAWDVTGSGKTSIRAGYGIFYAAVISQATEAQANTQPYSLNVTLNSPGSFVDPWGAAGIADPFPYTPSPDSPFVLPLSQLLTFDPHFRTGYNQQWQFAIERQVTGDSLVRAAYVGSKGTKLWWNRDKNYAIFIPGKSTASNVNSRRPVLNVAQLDYSESRGTSNYHALQLSFRRRLNRGLTFEGAYSWSKSIDLNTWDRAQQSMPYPDCPNCNRGRSNFDVSHVFVSSFVWQLPFLKGRRGIAGSALGGWNLSGIVSARSGIVFSVLPGSATSLSGTGGERADLIGDYHLSGDRTRDEKLAKWFNTAAFAVPAQGSWGSSGRNILEGPGSLNFDLALAKDFRVRESHAVRVRAESSSALNHPNFGTPGTTVSSTASFGKIQSAGGARVMQVSLQYTF